MVNVVLLPVLAWLRHRSRCHGISAASGKAGAIVGSLGFLYPGAEPKDKANTDHVRIPAGHQLPLKNRAVDATSPTAGFS
ncbi:hypothetical protein PR202_ga21836 [Eleusine coracana subsp. coracana]|uniref:Secreted protein n=1 Tax=Eleusine coracana subsp. coracana TaxID=191504 RepID=A0AAV5D2D9_ELECO|nr:hypothetical protein PR202_ga21836 [Eleusine coracana subsp. coracana]